MTLVPSDLIKIEHHKQFAIQRLSEMGFATEFSTDFATVAAKYAEIGKTSSMGALCIDRQRFTKENVFFIFLKDNAGYVATAAARCDPQDDADPHKYFRRTFTEQHPATDGQDNILCLAPDFAELKGQLIYFGNLFITPKHRRSGMRLPQALMMLLHAESALRWPNFDYSYGITHDRMGKFAGRSRLGFKSNVPNAIQWRQLVDGRENTEHLIWQPASHVMDALQTMADDMTSAE